jgi:hypothetical protein
MIKTTSANVKSHSKGLLVAAFLMASLAGCQSKQSATIVTDAEDSANTVKDDYYGPGGMRDYKKDKDKEAKLKAKEACQEAQIDLVEAQSVNDVALAEALKRKINKLCAENLKNKENPK